VAKFFYDIGSYGPVSQEENLQHLKEELLRQVTLGDAVQAFNRVSHEENIPVYGEHTFF